MAQCGRWAVRAVRAVSAVRAQCVWWGGAGGAGGRAGAAMERYSSSLSFGGASLFLRGKKTCGEGWKHVGGGGGGCSGGEIVLSADPARAVYVQSPMHGVHTWPKVLVWTPETLRASQSERDTSVPCCLYLSEDSNALDYISTW